MCVVVLFPHDHSLHVIVQYLLHSCCQFICVLLTAAVGLLHSCCATTIVYYYHLLGYSAAWGLTNIWTVTFCPYYMRCLHAFQELRILTGNAVCAYAKCPFKHGVCI